jgi:hypothetical protein
MRIFFGLKKNNQTCASEVLGLAFLNDNTQ